MSIPIPYSPSRLMDRQARSYFEWNDNGTIHKYDARSCAHCRCIMVKHAPKGAQPLMGGEAGIKGGALSGEYDYNCKGCGGAFICKRCAYEMHAAGDVCVNYERRTEAIERLCSDYSDEHRFPKIDRDIATLLGMGRR
jgi:hypothetical protein